MKGSLNIADAPPKPPTDAEKRRILRDMASGRQPLWMHLRLQPTIRDYEGKK
jgi:hypothetical protein